MRTGSDRKTRKQTKTNYVRKLTSKRTEWKGPRWKQRNAHVERSKRQVSVVDTEAIPKCQPANWTREGNAQEISLKPILRIVKETAQVSQDGKFLYSLSTAIQFKSRQ